jgi:hypothetical protein
MPGKRDTITWITRNTNRPTVVDVDCVVLLHYRGEREAGRLTITFSRGSYRYRMILKREEDRGFTGICDRFAQESEQWIEGIPVRCCLFDSLEADALTLSLSPWVDDDRQESDWMGRFENVQRMICKDQELLSQPVSSQSKKPRESNK